MLSNNQEVNLMQKEAGAKSSDKRGTIKPNLVEGDCSKASGKLVEGGLPRLKIPRVFTQKGIHPFDKLEWEIRQAVIKNAKGKVIFEQADVEVPKSWSMLATNIVASKYFYGSKETAVQETSVRQLIHRATRTIADWGFDDGYFESPDDADVFYNDLTHICVNQYAAFNSPVWFNVGLHQIYSLSSKNTNTYYWDSLAGKVAPTKDSYEHPQASACFIQAVDDTMEDIMRLASSEAMLFKYGSGTGTDLSTLRSSREKLSGGGTPSGPLSFMRVFDQVAAVVKSGGKTRRAAKMQSLKVSHPDIMGFITAKVKEEKKAHALVAAGYDASFDGEAYSSVMFQNANFSVRVSDDFLKAVEADAVWHTKAVTTGEIIDVLDANTIMKEIAEAAHYCGDPGLQYDTTINRWHTCPNSGRINASNPCSEYMFLDNSACNLASINLMKFLDKSYNFDVERFLHVVRIIIIAQDILVDHASYPGSQIAENSHKFRPLGLGYANLGALIMSLGIPYDSDEARSFAAVLTALMTGHAYATSSELAMVKGTFAEFNKNSESMLKVMQMHCDTLNKIRRNNTISGMLKRARNIWDNVIKSGKQYGFCNAQVTVLAPTGTIGFLMDCDTTGIEPDIALVKYKQLAGGGLLKIINQALPTALMQLNYSEKQVKVIIDYVNEKDTIEGAPELKEKHLPVFDCAFKPKNGNRFINYHAHITMMAAVQPFLSGAISKTVNMPNSATPEDIRQVYLDSWKMGLKAVAIYRDGSKGIQPVSTGTGKSKAPADTPKVFATASKPFRRHMPATRQSITHKFEVTGHEGYLTVGLYEDGTPGELFITMAKEGSTVGGLMDAFGTAISMCLQYGVPTNALITKFSHSRFEPSGFTKNPDIPFAKSLVDYIFRWLSVTFPDGQPKRLPEAPLTAAIPPKEEQSSWQDAQMKPDIENGRIDKQFSHFEDDAPVCDVCGSVTVRNGSCYRCFVCGNSMGCS